MCTKTGLITRSLKRTLRTLSFGNYHEKLKKRKMTLLPLKKSQRNLLLKSHISRIHDWVNKLLNLIFNGNYLEFFFVNSLLGNLISFDKYFFQYIIFWDAENKQKPEKE